jgi:SAM-dependent methyltransferase
MNLDPELRDRELCGDRVRWVHESDQRLSSSFGSAAAAYVEHRPDYPIEAVQWALHPAPGRRVLDLGAGTGKLTANLLDAGFEVIAVEPDRAMLNELRSSLPGVDARDGSAESIPLPSGSVDAVVAGNAMHWFDMDLAGPEIARVLTTGGVLAGLWNLMDDQVGWVAELTQVAGSETIGPRDTPESWRIQTAHAHLPREATAARFDAAEQAEFSHRQQRTAESLVATFSTKAGVLVMPAREREARLAQIRDFLTGRPELAFGEFTLPMVTGVLRTRRL